MSEPDETEELLTAAQWQAKAEREDVQRRCASAMHAPLTISTDNDGMPLSTSCLCGDIDWTPSAAE